MINFNGIYFNISPSTERGKLKIRKGLNIRFYEKDEYEFNSDMKFTVRKNQNLFQFFIDEQFLHATEIDSFETSDIITSFSSFNSLENNETKLEIELFEYN